jgi:hypothetical protein
MVSTKPLGRRRIGFHLILRTLAVLVLTAGLGLTLTFYLLAMKIPGQSLYQIVFVNGSLFSDEGVKHLSDGVQEANLRGLLITSATVSFTGISFLPMTPVGTFTMLIRVT